MRLRSEPVFLPIGTDRPLRRPTLVNYVLIGACVVVFLAQLIVQDTEWGRRTITALMLRPTDMVWWNLLSYQFLHADFMHLAGNMLFLWVFGPNIEDRLGRWGHLALFLVGGMAAGGLHAAFDEHPVLGASGAIAAVTGAYMVFFPRTRIRVLLFFFLIGVYSIPSVWFIGFAIARDLFWTGVGGTNVATLAHLGGYGFGFAVALTLLATKVVSREPYDLLTIGRQAKRRREFRSYASSGRSPWSHEAPTRKLQRRPSEKTDAEAEEQSRKRAAVSAAARGGQREEAMRLYRELASESPGVTMNKSLQLDLAGWMFESGRHAEADAAYERYLEKHPHDSEAHRVRLMSALIRGRYLDDAAGAAERLGAIDADRLSDDERALYEALRSEAAA